MNTIKLSFLFPVFIFYILKSLIHQINGKAEKSTINNANKPLKITIKMWYQPQK